MPGIDLAWFWRSPTTVTVLTDLRYSARSLTRTPGLAAALLLTIAFGIGSNAVVHGFVRGLLTCDLPVPNGDAVVSVVAGAPLLLAAASGVFLIACANVACLLLSRASARSQETAVRVALGASRTRLARQVLSDSVLISVAGGALGMLLAVWTTDVVPLLFFDRDAVQLVFAPDLVRISAVSAACVGITIACGLVPLFEIRGDRPAAVLQRENAGPSTSMRRLRTALVVGQMALCCALVIATGQLLESFRSALQTNASHPLRGAILATVESQPRSTPSETASSGMAFFRAVEGAARSVPGVTPRAWVATLPGGLPSWQQFRVEPPDLPVTEESMHVALFTPATLSHIRVPPIAGRLFGGRDTPQACRVAIVNDAAARDVFGGDAVGRLIDDPSGQRVEIVGVVASRQGQGADETIRPTIYQVVSEGARLAAAGTLVGMLASIMVARWLARIAPHHEPVPFWVWVAAPLVLLAAVVVASALPVRRALMVDPITITRADN